ncbi:class II fumarate hydratase, partial [Lactobacillus sp. XV13L]|nr:class II fumarate hydratase [Lactobacillus sp. XV13L]
MTQYRVEEDTLGPVKIPETALWGAQTERSRNNFQTGGKMPLEIIKVLLQIKRAAAIANKDEQAIAAEKADLIVAAIDKLLALDDEQLQKDFPLVIYQTGS